MVNIGNDWDLLLREEFEKEYYLKLREFLKNEYYLSGRRIYPPMNDIFNALKYTSLENTRVVILGQDPYHGYGQAHGLCFSVKEGTPPPPSLKNIFKELFALLCRPFIVSLINWYGILSQILVYEIVYKTTFINFHLTAPFIFVSISSSAGQKS